MAVPVALRLRDDPLIRSQIRLRLRLESAALQVARGLPLGPVPNDEAAEHQRVMGLELLGPLGHLLGMLGHELIDAFDKRPAGRLQFRVHAAEIVASDLLVPPDARAVILIHQRRTGDFGQSASGQTIVLQQLLEPILGLRVPGP